MKKSRFEKGEYALVYKSLRSECSFKNLGKVFKIKEVIFHPENEEYSYTTDFKHCGGVWEAEVDKPTKLHLALK